MTEIVCRENERMSMRIDLEGLSPFGFIITTSASDSECVSVSVSWNQTSVQGQVGQGDGTVTVRGREALRHS